MEEYCTVGKKEYFIMGEHSAVREKKTCCYWKKMLLENRNILLLGNIQLLENRNILLFRNIYLIKNRTILL